MIRALSCGLSLLMVQVLAANEPKVSFRNDILPLFARQGCSSASCHGSPRGQGGLQLSLWGLDPESDHANLVKKDNGRRVKGEVGKMLLLAKPSRDVEHKGGLRLPKESSAYATVRKWIEEGCNDDVAAPQYTAIEVRQSSADGALATPSLKKCISEPAFKLVVHAIHPDRSKRDVTHLAVFTSSNEALAAVTVDGEVTPWSRGLVAINIRFQQHLATIYLTIQDDAKDFVWAAPKPGNFVDEHVYAQLKELQILPAQGCTDEEFLRRVHLDVLGILPEVDQVRKFLADKSQDKRMRLIDELLSRPEHAKFWAQRWGDLLQITQKSMGRASALAYAQWLQEAWAKNLPYDQVASELLLAKGDTAKDPKANFFRMGSDHFETMEAASVIFLGAQIQCAKCHNHPSEKWTQLDYHGLRNFFSRVTVTAQKDTAMVNLGPAMAVKLPDSQKVAPPWLPGIGRIELKADDPRAYFARWLTAKENEFFAAAEANRLWALLMGRGIVEPFDDMRVTNPPSNPPLLAALAREFVEHKFDRRHLLRMILQSNTYQASTRPAAPFQNKETGNHRGVHEKLVKPFLAKHCVSCHGSKDPEGDLNLEAIEGTFQKEQDRRVWQKVLDQTMRGTMPPKRKAQPTADERRGFLLAVRAGVKPASASDDKAFFARYQPRRLTAEQLLDAIAHVTGVPETFSGLPAGTRATHLPVPDLNPHEFLQAFGQPQRSNTCSCDRPADANLGEALALYNGKAVQDRLKNSNNRFRKALKEKKSDVEIVEILFLAAYCRPPRAEESAAALQYVSMRKNREQAWEDLCWALMTTSEFLSQH